MAAHMVAVAIYDNDYYLPFVVYNAVYRNEPDACI